MYHVSIEFYKITNRATMCTLNSCVLMRVCKHCIDSRIFLGNSLYSKSSRKLFLCFKLERRLNATRCKLTLVLQTPLCSDEAI